ncbi:MAG: DUF4417 domain-containing protein [Lachnospiraceae bacterium]|nr:DUF4417 domain-containing protein [Lachnospiraceae bacterium]
MKSSIMRENPLFMRNSYESAGKWGIPLVKKQDINLDDVHLIACSDTRTNDNELNKRNGIHFFVDDYRFADIYEHPERSLSKYSQYAFLLTPDFSTYADMDLWRQLESVAKNRWCGAFWQSHGLKVIPTVSWGTSRSFDFCFDGIETNSIVAIGMIGCKRNRLGFMHGYDAMLDKINPAKILCLGTPFPEMEGTIIQIDYRDSRKVVR